MSRPAHWALSPLDFQAHLLLAEGRYPKAVLRARCGHLLPVMAMRFAELSTRKCTDCHLMSLSDAILSLRRENGLDDAEPPASETAPSQEGRLVMTWYQRSGRDYDTHRGTLCRGRVQAACGVMFAASGTALLFVDANAIVGEITLDLLFGGAYLSNPRPIQRKSVTSSSN